jgi:MFS family permease
MARRIRRSFSVPPRGWLSFRSARCLITSSVPDEYRGRAFGLEGIGDNLGAFLWPLLAVLLFLSFHFEIRWIFFVAIVPGLLAFLMVLLVHERPVPVAAKSKIDVSFREFPVGYWKYLLVIAIFEIGNSSNSFLILQTKNIGASFAATILIYAGFNLMAALISYPAGSLSDRWGRRSILLASFVIFFVAYLGFARARSVAAIAVLFVFYGLFQGIFRSVGKHLLPISCQSPCAQVASAGTVLPSDFWDWSQALSLVCCGTTSVTLLCFIYGAIFAIAGSVGLLFIPGKTPSVPR